MSGDEDIKPAALPSGKPSTFAGGPLSGEAATEPAGHGDEAAANTGMAPPAERPEEGDEPES